MHLNIFIVLLFPIFSGGDSLMCYECKNVMGSCVDEQVVCPSGTLCGSITTSIKLNIVGNNVMNIPTKGCVLPEICESLSINYGLVRTATSVQCCKTHLCNIKYADSTSDRPNGKQCYSCDGTNCSFKLDCLGNEDHCIRSIDTTKALTTTLKGCASKSICDNVQHMNDRFKENLCCKGNLCNTEENLHYMKTILHLWDDEDNLWDAEYNLWADEDNL